MAANIIQAVTGFAGGPLAMPPSIALVGVNDAKAAITLILDIYHGSDTSESETYQMEKAGDYAVFHDNWYVGRIVVV